MRVSSMIAANALLSKEPWNRLRPSLTKSDFAKEMRNRNSRDTPDNVLDAITNGDAWYEDAVLTTARWINQQMQNEIQRGNNKEEHLAGESQSLGDAVYTPPILRDYDRFVWGFNCPFLWRIHMEEVKGLYNDCILRSTNHAEVGAGTGLFLQELNVPESLEHVTLIDSNINALQKCQEDLPTHPHYEYSRVQFKTLQGDILQVPPRDLLGQFDSISANFLLHCLPGVGDNSNKPNPCRVAVENLASMLDPRDGVMFGTTLLGQAVMEDANRAGPAAVETLQLYNDLGIFDNIHHNFRDLSRIMHDIFDDVEISRIGYCAVWKCRFKR